MVICYSSHWKLIHCPFLPAQLAPPSPRHCPHRPRSPQPFLSAQFPSCSAKSSSPLQVERSGAFVAIPSGPHHTWSRGPLSLVLLVDLEVSSLIPPSSLHPSMAASYFLQPLPTLSGPFWSAASWPRHPRVSDTPRHGSRPLLPAASSPNNALQLKQHARWNAIRANDHLAMFTYIISLKFIN